MCNSAVPFHIGVTEYQLLLIKIFLKGVMDQMDSEGLLVYYCQAIAAV